MLIRLLPEQASRQWSEIKPAIEASLPPIVGMQSDRMSNILRAILMEEIIVWVSTNDNKVNGIVSTTFTFDKISGTKTLLVYTVYGYGDISSSSWKDGVETLRKFALSNSCNMMIAYTNVPSILRFIDSIGGQTDYRLISMPLERLHESIQ